MKNRRWFIPFGILVVLAICGLLVPELNAQQVKGGEIVGADVAWMPTATGLVLLMTPGLSFFYGGTVGYKNVQRLKLRSFELKDFEAFAGMFQNPDEAKFLGGTLPRGEAWRKFLFGCGHWALLVRQRNRCQKVAQSSCFVWEEVQVWGDIQ